MSSNMKVSSGDLFSVESRAMPADSPNAYLRSHVFPPFCRKDQHEEVA